MSFVKPTLDLKTSIWESTYTSPKWVYPCLDWTKLKPYNKFIYETLVYYHSKDFKCSSELETSEDIFLGGFMVSSTDIYCFIGKIERVLV